MARGRGESSEQSIVPPRLKTVTVGDVYTAPDQREITIAGAVPQWAHLCVAVKDSLGTCYIDPRVLQSDYTLKQAAAKGAQKISVVPPVKKAPSDKKNPESIAEKPVPMTNPQAGYLHRLCEDTGETFNSQWTKKEASDQIIRLKKKLGTP